ncbi:hypothetical protein FACS1894191_8870 [Clostridia bacterium]|nr:hypothetical protein FACS1894191_8870 [Clostridia bacterium]
MIAVAFQNTRNGLSGISVSGHAGYDDAGKDIVCAAVTSAVQLTANSMTEVFGINAKVDVPAGGEISIRLPADCPKEGYRLMEGLRLHLDILSQQYGDFIDLKVLEV